MECQPFTLSSRFERRIAELTPVEERPVDTDNPPQQLIRPLWSLMLWSMAAPNLLPEVLCAVVRAQERQVCLLQTLHFRTSLEDGRDPPEEDVADWRAGRQGRDGPEWDGVRFDVFAVA